MEWTDQDRVKEFNSTRKCSTYNSILDTRIYSEGYLHKLKLNRHGCTVTAITYSDTVQEILESSKSEYVAALNFADGYMPGGLVLYGAATQEEALCRSSNLYESLIVPECDDKYYKYNSNNAEFKYGKCSDRLIYTRNVTFFRDSDLEWLHKDDIRVCDIITCPAPMSGTATDEEIKQRMSNILKVAQDNRVNKLILGCWGCGAFGNNWSDFFKMWMDTINELDPNLSIVFATRGREVSSEVLWGGNINEY